MQNLLAGHMGYGTGTFLHIQTTGEALFSKTYIPGKYFFLSFSCIIFTLDTIFADNKDKRMVGCNKSVN